VVDPSQGRLRRPALTMAASSHVARRIEAILREGRTFSPGMSRTGWATLMLCAVPVLLGAGVVELSRRAEKLTLAPTKAAALPTRTPVAIEPLRRPVVQVAQVQTAPPPATLAASPSAKFDLAKITPCAAGDGEGRSGRGGGKGRGIPSSPPGHLYINCMSVFELINHVVMMTGPLLNDFGGPFQEGRVRGGPAWIYSDYYTIDAETSDPAANVEDPDRPGEPLYTARKLMSGPMLSALLAERFALRMHHATEDTAVYALVNVNGASKLRPGPAGGCEWLQPGQRMVDRTGQKPYCVAHSGWEGPNWTIDFEGQNLSNLALHLGGMILDRPAIDKTGIKGEFSFHLKFAHDAAAPGNLPKGFPNPFTEDAPAPTLKVVLEEQLGLSLTPDRAPREFIVVESAERPQ